MESKFPIKRSFSWEKNTILPLKTTLLDGDKISD